MKTSLFTEQHGFEYKVLFEVNRNDGGGTILGYFKEIDEKGRTYPRLVYQHSNPLYNSDYSIQLRLIESIRILSGPFACWQFAPVKAEFAILWEDGDIGFETASGMEAILDGLKDEYGDEIDTAAPKYKILDRPWWSV